LPEDNIKTLEELKNDLWLIFTHQNNRVFLVLDGASFAGLPEELAKHHIAHRPLYRNSGNFSVVRGGPWIVTPYRPLFAPTNPQDIMAEHLPPEASMEEQATMLATLMEEAIKTGDPNGGGLLVQEDFQNIDAAWQRLVKVLNILPDLSAVVFWIGDQTADWDRLYYHLRRLNRIWIPKTYAEPLVTNEIAQAAPTPYGDFRPEHFDFAVFRHAHADTLAQILPALDASKRLRFMGEFQQILFCPKEPWAKDILAMDKPQNTAANEHVPLFLPLGAMQALEETRLRACDRQYADLLLQNYLLQVVGMGEDILLEKVRRYNRLGYYKHHFRHAHHLYHYSAIHILYEDELAHDEAAKRLIAAPDIHAQDKLAQLYLYYPLDVKEVL